MTSPRRMSLFSNVQDTAVRSLARARTIPSWHTLSTVINVFDHVLAVGDNAVSSRNFFSAKCITNTHKIVSVTVTIRQHAPAKCVIITKIFTIMGNFVKNRLKICENAVV